ncbi:MAG: hypothetical protein WAO52_09210 [Prolixibacteraceae bacterium]
MNTKQTEKLMSVLLGISGALILLGAIFRLQHWPNGYLLMWIGFMSSFIFSSFEINRLKNIIKLLEKQNPPVG